MSDGYTKEIVEFRDRSFLVQILNFQNGSFISVTEGNEKIGGMIISINSGPVPTSTNIIPAKSESLFLKLISEKIASIKQGICVITGYFEKPLDIETTKQLMNTILEKTE